MGSAQLDRARRPDGASYTMAQIQDAWDRVVPLVARFREVFRAELEGVNSQPQPVAPAPVQMRVPVIASPMRKGYKAATCTLNGAHLHVGGIRRDGETEDEFHQRLRQELADTVALLIARGTWNDSL